ncbi:13696_t:CDS:2 [Funneliformis geosporum]|uniref:13696_t:CDS:1 n=1 Tax=Funneliformis geosporum TaxID=1117311 RepID=A0A9W4WSX6_9GLOM|nr:13696_t:CDS:2 [Funneliformis geosporum]
MSLEIFELLSRDFLSLLDTGEYSDVIIQVGQEPFIREFRVHSLILRTRSLYFRNALSNTWARTKGNYLVFQKPNISPKVFEIILEYIYGATVKLLKVNVKIILEILKAADELCINELVERIQEFLLYNPELILKNLVLIHRFVTEYDHFTELQTFCLNTINQDPAIFFEAEDFITIDQNTLLFILKASNLIMKEIDVWNKIVEWGIAQDPLLSHDIETWTSDTFSKFRNIVQPFVTCIKFALISQDDFFEKVRPFNQEIGVESLSSGIGTRLLCGIPSHRQTFIISRFKFFRDYIMQIRNDTQVPDKFAA